MRIVSLVPSLTEFLYDLDLNKEVVGITKFCVHPESWFKTKERVGGTKNPNIDKIKALNPDLIIANKEENRKEDIEALLPYYEVLLTDINNLEEQKSELLRIAKRVDRLDLAAEVLEKNDLALNNIAAFSPSISVVYLIWKDPIMSVAHPCFIHEMMELCGLNNLANQYKDRSRYPQLSDEELQDLNPNLLLLSSEPYPFAEKHILHFQKLLPSAKILIVDGEMFSWYGSRIQFFNNHWLSLKQQILSL